jgi:hypothetical protein
VALVCLLHNFSLNPNLDALADTVKKGYDFPVPSRDVTNQSLLGGELLNYSHLGEFGL